MLNGLCLQYSGIMQICNWLPIPVARIFRGAWVNELTRVMDASSVPLKPGPALRCNPTTRWLAQAYESLRKCLFCESSIWTLTANHSWWPCIRSGLNTTKPSPAWVDVGLSLMVLNLWRLKPGTSYVSKMAWTNSSTLANAIRMVWCESTTPTDKTVKLLKFASWFHDICWWFDTGMQLVAMFFKLHNCTNAPGSEKWRDASCTPLTSVLLRILRQ